MTNIYVDEEEAQKRLRKSILKKAATRRRVADKVLAKKEVKRKLKSKQLRAAQREQEKIQLKQERIDTLERAKRRVAKALIKEERVALEESNKRIASRVIKEKTPVKKILNTKEIKETYLEELQTHRERTGVSSIKLFDGWEDAPEGLNTGVVNSWTMGKTKTANPDYMYAVLKRWKSLPDKAKPLTAAEKAKNKRLNLLSGRLRMDVSGGG